MSLRYEHGSTMRRNLSLLSYYDYWVELVKASSGILAPNTITTYQVTSEHLKRVLPNIKLIDVDYRCAQAAFNKLSENYAHETVMKDLGHVRAMARSAVRNGDMRVNCFQDIKVGGNQERCRPKNERLMDESDFRKIQLFLGKYDYKLCDVNRMALYLIPQSGIRVGECLALQYTDVDYEQRTLTINKSWDSTHRVLKVTKTKAAERIVPVSNECLGLIKSWSKVQSEGLKEAGVSNADQFVLMNKNGRLPVANSINASYHQVQKKLKIPAKYSTHAIRHQVASLIVKRGLSVAFASHLLGHSSTTITERYYVDLLPQQLEAANRKVVDVINGN